MERLLEQLEAIEAIVDTVSPAQIERDPEGVADRYQLYARSYDPIEAVKGLRDRAIAAIGKTQPVNGYLSADYGYGKTATMIYLWSECQSNGILAVPPFKFKELGDLMVASYGWMKASLQSADQGDRARKLEALYRQYSLQSQEEEAAEIARKYKLAESKALKIVQALKAETTNTDSILNFWRESVPILRKAGFKGLAIFADESQEFLRAEEGASIRIQILSDLVKGMRALGKTPVALILSMPVLPTEAAIEEQAGDIIHRMKEQKISLRLADAYNAEFPGKLWDSLCEKFLEDSSQKTRLAHPATIESLGQLCDRKDLTNGPRTIVEIFKRVVRFARDNDRAYNPLDLIDDYLTGTIQLYGSGERRIKDAIESFKSSISFPEHPRGQEVVRLLASFPAGVSETVAEELGMLADLRKLAADDRLYGLHIIQLTSDRFALIALSRSSKPTAMDLILNKFRQHWFGDSNNPQRQERATVVFREKIIPLLLPSSRTDRGFWTWAASGWKQDRFGFYNSAVGAPERYNAEFPKRSLVVSVGSEEDLMKFVPPEATHLDWRFYCSYKPGNVRERKLKITAIAGTGQVDFQLQLDRSFEPDYPPSFGLLKKAIPASQCSACMLLNLSYYMETWLKDNPDTSLGDRQQVERHRQDCHQYAIQLLFPAIETDSWDIKGLAGVRGAGTKLLESIFERKCKALFPEYRSFYHNLRPSLLKYKSALEKMAIAVRRSSQLYRVPKADLEKLLATAGSGLPSLLAIFHKHSLVGEYKIAGNQEADSKLKFTQHPLEYFIQQQLESKGRTETIASGRSQEEVKVLDYLDLRAAVQRLGYLTEELEEALVWLQLRRYVEWDKQTGIVRQALASPDFEDLLGRLSELSARVAVLRQVFDEAVLEKLAQNIDEERATIVSVASPFAQKGNTNQLTLFETPVSNSEEQQSLSEIALDRVQRKIQALGDRLETFSSEKRSAFQKELGSIKLGSENLTADLNASKVGELILGNSGLEPCLNDRRKQLERELERLNKDCHNLARAIATQLEEADILALHNSLASTRQSWQICTNTKKRLQPLVAGLEQWRIIVARASALRENLADDPQLPIAYDDEFVDRVVTYFSTHQIEALTEYGLLIGPLQELEERVKSGGRSRREAFEERLNSYQALLNSLAPEEYNLKTRCRYDDEDRQGSYESLKQAFLEKLLGYCDRQTAEWQALERDLFFLAGERDRDVTELSNQVTRAKDDLDKLKTELPGQIEDMEALAEAIGQLQALAKLLAQTSEEYLQGFERDENLKVEEKELLVAIDSFLNGVSISQLRQQMQEIKSGTASSLPTGSQDIWELVKVLHQKGYLEISLSRRKRQ
ncbi:MAG: hypothetical protein F6J93_26885 [Oscillatoria sp. SIO1A7]|nr:hypothetical protein [Oscillatoria sp. SIO1A7]